MVVNTSTWADYVFDTCYMLPALTEVEMQIKRDGKLSEIPSEEEVLANGIPVGEMNVFLLKKVEELYLYIFQLNSRILELEKDKTE